MAHPNGGHGNTFLTKILLNKRIIMLGKKVQVLIQQKIKG
jgi:hypothetical protein